MKKNEQTKINCKDRNCPYHGTISVRGRTFSGTVINDKMHRTATIELPRKKFIPKYERFEKRRTRIKAHNPDCIKVKTGDVVIIQETRPLSKTKSFVVVKIKNESS